MSIHSSKSNFLITEHVEWHNRLHGIVSGCCHPQLMLSSKHGRKKLSNASSATVAVFHKMNEHSKLVIKHQTNCYNGNHANRTPSPAELGFGGTFKSGIECSLLRWSLLTMLCWRVKSCGPCPCRCAGSLCLAPAQPKSGNASEPRKIMNPYQHNNPCYLCVRQTSLA
jgi:hypothetical protein